MTRRPIFVSQPSLPPLEDFVPLLEQIWENKILTNGGPFHQELEEALCQYLDVDHLSLFNNGTIALMTALQALGITGEVITTPYSFVATAHSLLWNGITPVFVDIEPDTLNLDTSKIESAITARTTAILPVHVYGNPCDIERIRGIAEAHGLKVIYDGAHAFAVRMNGVSVLKHGDLTILSFHATKAFNTFEGGAIISPDRTTKARIDQLKNFGITDEVTVVAAGINGKMNEVQAAFGLLQLRNIDGELARRQVIDARYRERFKNVSGIRVLPIDARVRANYSYFPILVEDARGRTRDEIYETLRTKAVYARRYFYPLVSEFPMYRDLPSAQSCNLPVATEITRRIICLPIHTGLDLAEVDEIASIVTA
jgi:dTDP-4-amino-4,6-dideoxygalactose transaminase